MATSEVKSFAKYFFFIFVFIISFCLINTKTVELFGLVLFFVTNLLFFVFIGKDLTDGSITADGKDNEWLFKYGTLLASMVLSFVSSIMMTMTIFTLQSKFSENHTEIQWSPTDRQNLDNAEILFVTATTFIGVVALYVYNTPDDIRKFTYTLFDNILNGSRYEGVFNTVLSGSMGNWLRVTFPIVIIGLGSALYGRLQMPPLEVQKTPKRVVCDPKNDAAIQQFKDSFIKTYWFLFSFLIIIFARPFVEANFNLFGLSPSMPLGFPPEDRSLVFGQNPSISLLSILTLGVSNLLGVNRQMSKKYKPEQQDAKSVSATKSTIAGLFGAFVLLIILSTQYGIALNILIGVISVAILGFIASFFFSKSFFGESFSIAITSILLMPVLRWDVIYLTAKYAFGFVGLLYAGFSIRDFKNIPSDNACLFRDAHIRQLYIAFIVFLIVYYSFNTFSASTITSIITNVMRYLVPPALLGITSYLVFITDHLTHLAPKLVVQ